MLDFDKFTLLTFDCYGTLIDWESGILDTLRGVVAQWGRELSDNEILSIYADIEAEVESRTYMSYKDTLRTVMDRFGERLECALDAGQRDCLVTALAGWPAFDDTVRSLLALKKRYKLAVISNTDDDLFAQTARTLEVTFDWVVTAQQVGAYKPSAKNFEFALAKTGVRREQILHVAQSIYHDIVPAAAIGLSTVWVNRRGGQEGFGATRQAAGTADLEVPDLAALVSIMGLE
ncbi:MAG: haloacid dehalogenase type II [Candidatus Latescibacterota bacterium]